MHNDQKNASLMLIDQDAAGQPTYKSIHETGSFSRHTLALQFRLRRTDSCLLVAWRDIRLRRLPVHIAVKHDKCFMSLRQNSSSAPSSTILHARAKGRAHEDDNDSDPAGDSCIA